MLLKFLTIIFCSVRAESPYPYNLGRTTAARTQTTNLIVFSDAIRMVYQEMVERLARPQMIFTPYAKPKTELSKKPGEQIGVITMNDIDAGEVLTEGVPILTQNLSAFMKYYTIFEHGTAVAYTNLFDQATFLSVMPEVSVQLARSYALTINTEFRDVMLSNPSVLFARSGTGGITSARGDITPEHKFTVALVKDALEVLAMNIAQPYNNNGEWICILHPHVSRDLRDDTRWLDVAKYATPTNFLTGEIGRIDNVRFIESIMMTNGAAPESQKNQTDAFRPELKAGFAGDALNPAIGTDIYRSVIFGAEYFTHVIAQPMTLRPEVADFGRLQKMAWYGIWGSGLLNAHHGIVLETA